MAGIEVARGRRAMASLRNVVFFAAVSVVGCRAEWLYAPQSVVARDRASRDLDCEQVRTELVGTREVYDVDVQGMVSGPVFRVDGCGHVGTYVCRLVSRPRDRRYKTADVPVCWADGTFVAR
jgi:hypothetical protein